MKKTFLKSKTVWLGIITGIGSLVASNSPELAVNIADNLDLVGGILAALIVGLRAATSTGLKF